MLNSVVYTYRLHVDDVFEKMPLMGNTGWVMVLFSLLILHHCFPVLLLILIYHSILESGLKSGLNLGVTSTKLTILVSSR